MQRYSVITGKLPREIVLLKGLPCVWSKCTFCDYIDDNTTDEAWIQRVADAELARVTGRFSRLEIINSGSIQELTPPVQAQVRDLLHRLAIREFICESYWSYRTDWAATRAFYGVPTRIKLGVETFDDHVRNGVLRKAMKFAGPEEVAALTDTICLLVGVRGQTRDMVRRDIDILLRHFRYGCVNLFSPNTKSAELMDAELKAWFREEYADLEAHPTVEVLWENTDFGVGDVSLPVVDQPQ
ncbi:MAG TPA: radical SAM protein [Phycisphaerae bacterium]|nr:radical SAM protein [Phycisphaerae bacterium]